MLSVISNGCLLPRSHASQYKDDYENIKYTENIYPFYLEWQKERKYMKCCMYKVAVSWESASSEKTNKDNFVLV